MDKRLNKYILKARRKITHKTFRDNVAFVKLFQSASKAIHAEFMREYRAAIKLMDKQDAFEKLSEYSQKEHPELYDKEKFLKLNPKWEPLKVSAQKSTEQYEKAKKKDESEINKYLKGWDSNIEPENMAKILGIYGVKAGNLGGQAAIKKLGIKVSFNLKSKALLNELKKRGEMIAGNISQRTLNDFRKILYTSYMEKGISPYEVKQKIEFLFEETYRNRAMAIARTETGIASSIVQHESYEKNGIEKKEWLATMDDKTRESHAEANGQIVPIDEPFQVGDAELMHPLDPAGPPEEVCNCRCDELPVIGEPVKVEEAWSGE
jgi:SPP1 gp7 family putative phage head morphogenesis protein